jgi:hypothetical protein
MNTHLKTGVAAIVLASTAGLFAACADDDSGASAADAYCGALRTDKEYFQSLAGSDPDVSRLDDAFDRMHQLSQSAPPAVAADWKTIDGAITDIDAALEDAGVKFSDFAAMEEGDLPQGADLEKIAALGPKLETLGGPELEEAAAHIEEHADDVCGVKLTDG